MLNTIKLLLSTILFALLLQGCGESSTETTTYPTALDDGVSVTTTQEGAVMAPDASTLKTIATEVGIVLKTDITTLNQKEAIDFTQETKYCEISGILKSENSGTFESMTTRKNYQACQNELHIQNGEVQIDYALMDSEGKYPQTLLLTVIQDYSFNEIELKKETNIEANITYSSNQVIQSIELKINGVVNYSSDSYTLQNITQTVEY